MPTETKNFDPRAVASVTTGVLLLQDFGQVHECVTWVLGREVWTHELPGCAKETTVAILAQYPDMPTTCADDWKETAADVMERYGASIPLAKGSTERTMSPVATLAMLVDDPKKIATINLDGPNAD